MMTQDRSTGQALAAPTSASSSTELQSPEAPQVSPRNLNPAAPAFHQLAPASPKNLNPSAPVFRQSLSSEQPPSDSSDSASYAAVAPATQGSGSSDGGGEGDVPYLPNGGIEGMALEDKTVMEDPANSGEELAGGEGEESASEQQQQHADQEEFKYPEELLAPVIKQMHYYFSSENLPNDKFLNGHMDSDKYIPLDLFLDFGRIKPICCTLEMLAQAVEASSYLELNETKDKVRVSQCRKTLTLRGFPGAPPVTEEEVRKFVLDIGAEMPTRIELVMVKDKLSTWYVSFRDMNAALNSFSMFHNKQAVYKGHNIGCCIKSSGTLGGSGYYPTPTPSATAEEQHHHHPHQQQRRMVVGGVVPHTQASAASGISTVTVTAPVPAHTVVPTAPSPMPQQPQQHQQQLQQQAAAAAAAAAALLPQYQTMQLHPSFVSGSHTSIYYPQTSPSYMQYMPGILPQGWPGAAAAMDPGIIMQSNGLQPQQIRSTPMPRPQLMPSGPGGPQHRFTRPQRVNRPNNSIDRSNSERGNDRQAPVVSVANIGGARSSPSTSASYMHHNQHHHHHPHHHRGGNSSTGVREDVASAVMSVSAVPQVVSAHHQQQQQQFVPPLVSQHQLQQQQPHATISTTTGTPSIEAPQYQHHHGQHPGSSAGAQSMMIQGATGSSSSTSSSNAAVPGLPPHATGGSSSSSSGIGQSQMQHSLTHHHNQQHHHSQPPPPLPIQQNQQPAQPSSHHHHHHHHPHHQQHHHPNQQHHHHHQSQQHHHQHHHHHQHQPPHLQHNHPPPQQNHHHQPHHHQHHHQQQHHHHNMLQTPPPLHSQHITPLPPSHHPHQQHQQQHPALPGSRSDRKPRRRREEMGRNQRVERAHRANFSSQVPPVADNFTMEANSFPPLPGAANNVANSEVSHENRLSDVVRGLPRVQGGINSAGSSSGSGGPAPSGAGPRGPSSSPSPVATPGLGTASAQSNHTHHSQQRGSSNQQADSDTSGALDDADTASSSQEDADVDGGSGDISVVLPVSTDSRANTLGKTEIGPSSEPHSHVSMSRSYKASAPANGAASGSRSIESRHSQASTGSSGISNHQGARGPQPAVQSPLLSPTAVAAAEAPKPSYAQIAQKTANVVAGPSGSDPVTVGASALQTAQTGQMPLTSSSNTTTSTSTTVPAQNGPSPSVSSHQISGNTMSTSARNSSSSNSNAYNQSPNHGYQREFSGSNYRPGQHRGGSGGASKDGNFQGSPLYQRPPNSNNNSVNNNRRNAKDKLTPNNINKYDRRKPEARQK